MGDVLTALAAGATVVTQGRRQAQHLRLAHDRRQAAAGHRAWATARVLPWGAWLRQLWPTDAGVAGGRRLLTAAEARTLWHGIVARDGAALTDGASRAAAAGLAWDAWQTCCTWCIDRRALARRADSRDSSTFAEWAAAYQRLCDESGWVDPALLADILADLVSAAPPGLHTGAGPVVLALGEEASPQQRRFVGRLAAAGLAVEALPADRTAGAGVRRRACRDAADELATAGAWARALKEREPLARVGIVVPDLASRLPEVRRRLLDVVAPDWRGRGTAEDPVDLGRGESLAAHGAVHGALAVLDLLAGPIDYRAAGQILRSPFIGGHGAEAAARAALDLDLRDRVGTRVDVTELAARCAQAELRIAACFERLRDGRDDVRRLPGAWARRWSRVLADFGWPGDARGPGDPLRPVVEAWQLALDGLAALDRLLPARTCGEALQLLRSACEDATLPATAAPDAIQVLGLGEALEGEFDALWVTGMHESAWPPPARPSPLLPIELQRAAAIPHATPQLSRLAAARRFEALAARARQLVCSWPALEGEAAHRPSPPLAGVPPLEDVTSGREAPTVLRQQYRARPALPSAPDPAPALRGRRRLAGGTRALALQAACPARAFFESRLGAREFPAPAAGLTAAARGLALHAVLQAFFDGVRSHESLLALAAGDCRARISALVEQHLADVLDAADPFQVRLLQTERTLLAARIDAFLAIERQRMPFEIERLETDSDASLGGLLLRVRPDRVDRLASGHRLVLDYKSGSFQRSAWKGPRPQEPQLPVYATLLDADAVAAVRVGRGATTWVAAGAPEIDLPGMTPKSRRDPPDRWAATRSDWRSALATLAAEILGGDCRINRWQRRLAEGEWTMLTRVHELPDDGIDGEDDA